MSCPDPYRSYNPFDQAPTPDADFKVHSALPSDAEIRGLTSALAASGGGVASEDLALDLVLNQIVEQACLATGATGAAIALTRNGEMVCRATTGRTAPDLGVRLDNAGFSAECLRVGTLQRCDDTETDPRVDSTACRLLGVRSILVVPLWYWGEFMGILEIFSPRPNAFGERDEQTLQALAYRIVRHAKQASGHLAGFSSGNEQNPVPPVPPAPKLELRPEPVPVPQPDPEPVQERPRTPVLELRPKAIKTSRPHDQWTTWLAMCAGLIACLIVGLMVWRLGWKSAAAQSSASNPSASQAQDLDLTSVAQAAQPATTQPSESSRLTAPKPEASNPAASSSAISNSAPKAESSSATAADVVVSAVTKRDVAPPAPVTGGLAIYDEKGKLIYGAPIHPEQPAAAPSTTKATPKPGASAQSPASLKSASLLAKSPSPTAKDRSAPELIDGRFVRLKPELAENLLDQRIEPEYPDAARRAHIQGSVTLETLITASGRVQQVTPVSGNPQLADAAVTAVRRWRYKPFTVDGRQVPIRTQVTVTFMLAQ
jgi:TonB family protein